MENHLSLLPTVAAASFDSLQNQNEPTCLPGTRAELLKDLSDWVDSSKESSVYWLSGSAGTGKSTVSRTIAKMYHDKGTLAGSFFFVKGGGDLGNATGFAATLAHQVAARVPEARPHIDEAIMKQQDIMQHSLREQWKQLVLEPLSKLPRDSPQRTLLFVIDALDECDGEKDMHAVLGLLGATKLSNMRLRIIVTSRALATLCHGFAKMPDAHCEMLALHDVPFEIVNRDIKTYFDHQLATIREEHGFDNAWPGCQTVERLVEMSVGLFIWASTACRFIQQGKQSSVAEKRLDSLLNQSGSSLSPPERHLDEIYTTVLQEASKKGPNKDEKGEPSDVLKEIIGTIVILSAPLSAESLSSLLGRSLVDITDTLVDLHTILNIPSQSSLPIRLHHPSLRDFLLNKERCLDPNLWVDEKTTHRALSHRCLDLMSKALKRNICSLTSPGAYASDVDPDQIQRCIPLELQYACLYWVEHCHQAGVQPVDGDEIDQFFRFNFLYWLEASTSLERAPK